MWEGPRSGSPGRSGETSQRNTGWFDRFRTDEAAGRTKWLTRSRSAETPISTLERPHHDQSKSQAGKMEKADRTSC